MFVTSSPVCCRGQPRRRGIHVGRLKVQAFSLVLPTNLTAIRETARGSCRVLIWYVFSKAFFKICFSKIIRPIFQNLFVKTISKSFLTRTISKSFSSKTISKSFLTRTISKSFFRKTISKSFLRWGPWICLLKWNFFFSCCRGVHTTNFVSWLFIPKFPKSSCSLHLPWLFNASCTNSFSFERNLWLIFSLSWFFGEVGVGKGTRQWSQVSSRQLKKYKK